MNELRIGKATVIGEITLIPLFRIELISIQQSEGKLRPPLYRRREPGYRRQQFGLRRTFNRYDFILVLTARYVRER
mgnify:CR=1 FL=1